MINSYNKAKDIEDIYNNLKFRTFVPESELPVNGTIYVTTIDNVLDFDDFNIYKLFLKNGEVVKQEIIYDGEAYEHRDFVGWDTDGLARWSSYDGTGTYPEITHEISTSKLTIKEVI